MLRGIVWWLRFRFSDPLMSRCRVCGSSKDVIQYDPRGLWAYPLRRTWCPAHCPDHDYVYSRWEGHYCNNCGEQPDVEWYCDRAQAMHEAEMRP